MGTILTSQDTTEIKCLYRKNLAQCPASHLMLYFNSCSLSYFLTWNKEAFPCPFPHQRKDHKHSHYQVSEAWLQKRSHYCCFSSGGPVPFSSPSMTPPFYCPLPPCSGSLWPVMYSCPITYQVQCVLSPPCRLTYPWNRDSSFLAPLDHGNHHSMPSFCVSDYSSCSEVESYSVGRSETCPFH